MTHSELKELVKKHFSLVDAPSKEKFEETPRTAAEEEGYKDGMLDAIEDVKEAIAEVEKTDMAVEEEVDAVQEEAETAKEEMEEVEIEVGEEPTVTMEDVVKAVSEIVSGEMKKMEEKMAALEAKFEEVSMEPAAEKTIPNPSEDKTEKFSVAKAANSKSIEMALSLIKNKRK